MIKSTSELSSFDKPILHPSVFLHLRTPLYSSHGHDELHSKWRAEYFSAVGTPRFEMYHFQYRKIKDKFLAFVENYLGGLDGNDILSCFAGIDGLPFYTWVICVFRENGELKTVKIKSDPFPYSKRPKCGRDECRDKIFSSRSYAEMCENAVAKYLTK